MLILTQQLRFLNFGEFKKDPSMTIGLTSSGDYAQTREFLKKMLKGDIFSDLDRYGHMGVEALASATPVDTGLTASSWTYRVISDSRGPGIEWYNTDIDSQGQPIAILIQYGHGTGTGGYVQGRDFINPAIRPIFDAIADDVWEKVRL
jgi:hypothetical protein